MDRRYEAPQISIRLLHHLRRIIVRAWPHMVPFFQCIDRHHLITGLQEFLKAGYQVVTVNTLEKWDHVGPRSNDYPAQVVKEADAYLRRFVTTVHQAGARAVFYLGPVQSRSEER